MNNFGRPSGMPQTVRLLGIGLLAMTLRASAEPSVQAFVPWHAEFLAPSEELSFQSLAVPRPKGECLVAVGSAIAESGSLRLRHGNQAQPGLVSAYDPISRVVFLRPLGEVSPAAKPWLKCLRDQPLGRMQALAAEGLMACDALGWVQEIDGKVLPFALVLVKFAHAVPPPGTPVLARGGEVAAILFQEMPGQPQHALAIPAEAVHRVEADLRRGGTVVRGWVGMVLDATHRTPRIVRIIPESPADRAGLKQGDVLTGLGLRAIQSYSEAADAFFYVLPEQALAATVLRDGEALTVELLPTREPGK